MNKKPPKYAQKLLHWFLKTELEEEVLGDLAEKFEHYLTTKTTFRAKVNYWYQTLNYLRPFAVKNNILTDLNPFFMLNSYLKIARRSLFKQKLYSVINVIGMTIGMICFLLIALYVQYELSYDLQHEKSDRIYRVAQQQEGNTFRGTDKYVVTPMPIAPIVREEFPEVEAATIIAFQRMLFKQNNQAFYEFGLSADAFLFDVFTYPVIEGDVNAALEDKDAIILTEKLAKKYFGRTSPIGQTIETQDKRMLVVKAVIEDIPKNQHFGFDFIWSIDNDQEFLEDKKNWRWSSNNYRTYLVLKEGTDVQKVVTKMVPFGEKASAELAKFNLLFEPKYFLQPLTDIHLHSNINFESGQPGDIRYLYLAMSIAFIILLLALINYMNLATARTAQRSKEVGVRKVLGAQRKQLINQFMMEATLLTGVSLGLAVFFAKWLMPTFNQLMNLDISFNLSDNPWIFFGLATIAIVLSVSSGLYPAILSTAIGPVKALKGNWLKNRKGGGAFLRSSLVVGQFTAAIVLGISSVVIHQQLQYIQTKKLGFNREQILFVPFGNQPYFDKAATLRSELQKHPNIENITISSNLPINTNNQGLASEWEGKTANDKQLHIYRMRTDYHFFDVFEMELVEGRNFSPNFPTDSSGAYILNEAAVEAIGWESAVGKSFMDGRVVGVVKNFHFQPFDLTIKPMYISLLNHNNAYNNGNIVMKVKLEDSQETTAHIEQTLKTLFPELIYNINHLDEAYNNLYQTEQRFGDAFNIFTLIALFIACIGLFGLVTHSVLLRTKEIGIRKVLGASVGNIVRLISKDFLKLVVLSAVIAIPLAWWSMNTWLQDFAYRIDLNWLAFAVVGLVAILIAFLTVGFQSLKAALANPVETIQSE